MASITKPELIRLQKTLKTDAAIGEKFGITRQAVHQLRKKYGLAYNHNKTKERNEKILSLFRQNKSGTQIATLLDLSISQVYRIFASSKKKKK